MKRRIIALTLMSAVACMSITGCGILPTEEEFDAAPVVKEYEGASFNKVTVTRGTLRKTEEIMGKYKSTVREEYVTDGVGVVKKIHVKEGQRVEEGDTILSYNLPGSEKALKEAENQIEKLELQIKHAKRLMGLEVAKQKKLGGSKTDIANVKKQYQQQITSHESSLKLLRMDAKIAREEIEAEEITASVSGVVTFVDESAVGTYGDLEEPTIIIEGAKKNRFEANSELASHCKAGDVVTIEVKGQEYKATVKKDKESTDSIYFYPKTKLNVEDDTVCTYQVVLKEKKDVLHLPSSIVYSMSDKYVVYYEDANGLKATKEVQVGETVNNFIEITGGLEENEQVIAN
nr:efflux RND transporter periplasmic adaptor subunit [Eubacterium sp.]